MHAEYTYVFNACNINVKIVKVTLDFLQKSLENYFTYNVNELT